MPIYEYECTSCGKRFEIKQKLSDPPIQTCQEFSCEKSQPVTKIISPPAIMFKGSGWYVTDYSDKLKEGKKSEGEGTPDSKKESKPAAQPSTESSSSGTATSSSPATSSGNTGTGSTNPNPASTSTSS